MVWVILRLLAIAATTPAVVTPPTIVLTPHNFIVIQGEIDDASADLFLRDSMLLRAKPPPKQPKRSVHASPPHYVFIDTPGGSVTAGSRILNEIQRAKYICIADRAYSMGFVLLQGCAERLVMPTASLMQHPMSLEIQGDLGSVRSYMRALQSSELGMSKMQAERLGLTLAEFEARTASEWWLFGAADIFNHRAADGLVEVVCAPSLIRQNRTIVRPSSPRAPLMSIETRSRCPLLRAPLQMRITAAADDSDHV